MSAGYSGIFGDSPLGSRRALYAEDRDAIATGDAPTVERIIQEGTAAKRQELLERRRGDEP